jgi:general secretion pathway protein D
VERAKITFRWLAAAAVGLILFSNPQVAPIFHGDGSAFAQRGGAITDGRVSFNFEDADIFEVARVVFGEVLKVNYVINPEITGRVTFRTFAPIPRSEVLSVMEVILRINGIGFVVEGGIYRIVLLEQVPDEFITSQAGKDPDDLSIELLPVKNISVGDFMEDLQKVIAMPLREGAVKVLPIEKMNALLVIGTKDAQLENVRKWVGKIDGLFKLSKSRVFIYPVQNGRAEDIVAVLERIYFEGVQEKRAKPQDAPPIPAGEPRAEVQPAPKVRAAVESVRGSNLVSESARVFTDEVTNAIVVVGTAEDYEIIKGTIEQLDIVPRQVLIETMIAEVDLSDDFRFGIEWSLKNRADIGSRIDLKGETGFDSGNLGASALEGFTFVGIDKSGVVRAFLQAVESKSKVNVLAAPNLLAVDKKEANIQIGDQVPVATSETNVAGTSDIQRTIQYRDTGVILTIKPQINDGGVIALDITQEVSDFSVQNILGSDQVVISTTNASTSLVTQDGQTIIIGGLIRERKTKSRDYVPILGRIPILGYLFGFTSITKQKSEVVILLTPRVISDLSQAKAATEDFILRLNTFEPEIDKEKLIKTKEDVSEDSSRSLSSFADYAADLE